MLTDAEVLNGAALRPLVALALAWALSGCGSSSPAPAQGPLGGPSASPPVVKGNGPPLAWVSSGADRAWMAYSSYCWGQVCAEHVQPSERTDVPLVKTTLGSKVVFHLGFDPTSIGLEIPSGREMLELGGSGRQRSWTADRSALLVLNATGAADEQASYLVRVTLEEGSPGA